MCGGIAYKYRNIKESELKKYYSDDLLERFKNKGEVESFFWHKQAVLPIRTKDGVELKLWGNKDDNLKLPKTGWARDESLREGKWEYLNPEFVDIVADKGYEKKTSFDFENGTKGILVKKDKAERIYMITKEASEEYEKNTGHDREPLGQKMKYRRLGEAK